MKEKLMRFMQGRYGNDQLGRCLIYLSLLCIVLSLLCIVLSLFVSRIFYFLGLFLLIYSYFRMFSKNTYKRYQENIWYMNHTQGIRNKMWQLKQKVAKWFSLQAMKKNYRIFNCPSCNQKVRIPKGKGSITITCPRCGNQFIKRT